MRAIVQRVLEAQVSVDGAVIGGIDRGLLIFIAVHRDDSEREAQRLRDKILRLRIFADAKGKMNLDVLQTRGSLLIVSQFTLYGETSKGNRPSYSEAAPPEKAQDLYELFVSCAGMSVRTSRPVSSRTHASSVSERRTCNTLMPS